MKVKTILRSLALAGAFAAAGFWPRLSAPPPPGALVLTPLSFFPRLCLGERAAIDVLVTDALYGAPLGGATVVLSSSLGGGDTTWTPGGVTQLHYQPRLEGSDTILLTATAPNSTAGLASLPVKVDRCHWTWDLFYTGSFPHPEGFWRFTETATVAAGTLDTVAGGPAVEGAGSVAYSISAHGEVSEVSCDFGEISGATDVHVTGTVGQPAGSMTLEFAFDPAPIRGNASFNCRIGPERVSFEVPVSEASQALSSLLPKSVVLPTDFSVTSRTVPTAVFWLVPGSGRLTLVVTPVSNN